MKIFDIDSAKRIGEALRRVKPTGSASARGPAGVGQFPAIVRCTSLTPTAGLYPGVILAWDPVAGFTDLNLCWLRMANGGAPELDTRYRGLMGGAVEGRAIFDVVCCCSCTALVYAAYAEATAEGHAEDLATALASVMHVEYVGPGQTVSRSVGAYDAVFLCGNLDYDDEVSPEAILASQPGVDPICPKRVVWIVTDPTEEDSITVANLYTDELSLPEFHATDETNFATYPQDAYAGPFYLFTGAREFPLTATRIVTASDYLGYAWNDDGPNAPPDPCTKEDTYRGDALPITSVTPDAPTRWFYADGYEEPIESDAQNGPAYTQPTVVLCGTTEFLSEYSDVVIRTIPCAFEPEGCAEYATDAFDFDEFDAPSQLEVTLTNIYNAGGTSPLTSATYTVDYDGETTGFQGRSVHRWVLDEVTGGTPSPPSCDEVDAQVIVDLNDLGCWAVTLLIIRYFEEPGGTCAFRWVYMTSLNGQYNGTAVPQAVIPDEPCTYDPVSVTMRDMPVAREDWGMDGPFAVLEEVECGVKADISISEP